MIQINRPQRRSTVERRRVQWFSSTRSKKFFWIEALFIFICFALFAGQIPPDVNESHYLTKAKHFWNPEWCPSDIFLGSSFAHWLFYVGFGWLTKFVSLFAFAWIGRVLTWALLAIAWQYACARLFRIPFLATVTAMLFLLLNDRFQLAGEWVVGGFEAKGIAYALTIFALGLMIEQKWKYVWPILGLAAAFHVLVGGWAFLAALFAWVVVHSVSTEAEPKNMESLWYSLRPQFTPLLIGISLIAAGTIAPLATNWNTPAVTTNLANHIYVNHRIAHHLTFDAFPTQHIARFVMLTVGWIVLFRWSAAQFVNAPSEIEQKRLRTLFCFGLGSLLISLGGLVLSGLAESDEQYRPTAVSLLRFYWFRIADFAIPATFALAVGTLLNEWILVDRSKSKKFCVGLFAVCIIAAASIEIYEKQSDPRPVADQRSLPNYPGDDVRTQQTYQNWVKVCQWIDTNTDSDSVFITPHQQQTFKWYAGRTEVVNWKDIPQDAQSIVKWSQRVRDLIDPQKNFEFGLMIYSDEQLRQLAKLYAADYLLIPQGHIDLAPTPTMLKQVYPEDSRSKSTYVVFEF